MSAIDPIAAVLGGLDRPVAPRPEFAEALLARLLDELRAPVRDARRGRLLRLDWFLPGVPLRLRLALILIALLLLLAGIATATYLSVHTWVSAGPRGIQYSSDYKLSTVFAPPDPHAWQAMTVRFGLSFALDPSGHDLYALVPAGDRLPKLVRIRGVDKGTRLDPTRVLDMKDLAGPRFVPGAPQLRPLALAVAPNGDVFVLAGGRDPSNPTPLARGDAAVFVVQADGAPQRVLSLGELVRSSLLPNARSETLLSLAATAPDRLWLRAESFERPRQNLRDGSFRFFEVLDPNADGDWSDHVVRPIVLPESLQVGEGSRWFWDQLVAEQPLPGDDRARSVLSTAVNVDGGFRVYRIADFDDDGDALDQGEVQVVYEGRRWGMVAPVVLHVGGAAQRELVFAGLTRFDRISLVSASGAVTDIARSFPTYFGALLAGPGGVIYPVGESGIVYRLGPAGAGAPTGTPVPAAGSIPAPALPPAAGAVPQILFSTPAPASVGIKDVSGPLFAVGADGSGLRELPNGAAQCFSKDGRMIAFMSDAEVPFEPSAYVANADGSRVRKLGHLPLCPFPTPVMWLANRPGSLVRYDLRTGHQVGPALRVPGGLVLAPDGSRGVYLDARPSGTGSSAQAHRPIVLLDLSTLQQGELGPPVPAGSSGATREYWTYGIGWSPDGTRIAYVTVPRRPRGADSGRYGLFVRDVAGGSVIYSASIIGWTPRFTWSPDGASLLVCVDDRNVDSYYSCTGGAPVPAARASQRPPARLLQVELSDRSIRLIAREPLVFADLAPSGGTLAYATPEALFVRTRDGRTRKLAEAPGGGWPGGEWLGWSPDGRYIGLSFYGPGADWKLLPLATVDVHTGRLREIRTPPRAGWATWWRP